jgi:hypothetical protein
MQAIPAHRHSYGCLLADDGWGLGGAHPEIDRNVIVLVQTTREILGPPRWRLPGEENADALSTSSVLLSTFQLSKC